VFAEGSQHGTTNSTTEVTVVAAPRPLTRRLVKLVTFYNADASPIEVHLLLAQGATRRQIRKATLAAGASLELPGRGVFVLTEGQSLVAELTGAPTTQADFTAHFAEAS